MSDSKDSEAVEIAVKGLKEAEMASRSGLPPVDKWQPQHKHRIDMRIARDGSWHYQGDRISRAKLVKLFASILKREEDGSYHLVTPVEQAEITVEDVPFVCVAMQQAGEGVSQTLAYTTSVGDVVVAGLDHAIRFDIDPETDEPTPYVHIRGQGKCALEARINRAVYYDLVDLGSVHTVGGEDWYGVWSGNVFFKMQRASELELGPAG